ncbi:MAG: hypothetical protein GYB66_05700 [Chloroflexi bacterium]|nr:hypothetical protein [Chloroflexota bacterium]
MTSAQSSPFLKQLYGLALQADVQAVLQRISEADPTKLSAEERSVVGRFQRRFGDTDNDNDASALAQPAKQLLAIYHGYWKQVLLQQVNLPTGEERLRLALLDWLGRYATRPIETTEIDFDRIEAAVIETMAEVGFYTLCGVTLPLRELMVWRSQRRQEFEIALADGPVKLPIVFLGDFVSRGWAYFATADRYGAGGWVSNEALYCIEEAYNIESESFRVNYLVHEAQHYADRQRDPEIATAHLEYRAKLAELAQIEDPAALLAVWQPQASYRSKENPHAWANAQVLEHVSERLNSEFESEQPWQDAAPERIRHIAAELLRQDSQTLPPRAKDH